jgi:hypothetical protein
MSGRILAFTLYVMENARTDQVPTPALCTFASPFVGDSAFVAAFNALQLTSWRIVNEPDIVPKLPPEIFGFRHVDMEQRFSSIGKVKSSVSCWHSLATYLSLLDSAQQPGPDCQLAALTAAETVAAVSHAAAPPTAITTSIPTGPVTVNITINVGRSE